MTVRYVAARLRLVLQVPTWSEAVEKAASDLVDSGIRWGVAQAVYEKTVADMLTETVVWRWRWRA